MVKNNKNEEDKEVVRLLKDLINIPSYKDLKTMEGRLIDFLVERLKKINVSYELIYLNKKKIGIIATIGSKGKALIFHSHLDTVPPSNLENWESDPFTAVEKENKIYGLGACDTKGSLASMLYVFEYFARNPSNLKGRLILLAVGGEERGGLGTQEALRTDCRGDAVVLGEPTNLKPMIAHKGVMHLKITTKGVSAHASSPEQGTNAILYMAKVISTLDKLSSKIKKNTDTFTGNSSLVITKIKGGSALNVIPGACTITIDRRLIPGEKIDFAQDQIHHELKKLKEEDVDFKIEIERIKSSQPSKTDPNDPLVKLILQIVEESRAFGFSACCDMRFFRHLCGLPVVILGPGDIMFAHSCNEYIRKESLVKAVKIYKKIALNWPPT